MIARLHARGCPEGAGCVEDVGEQWLAVEAWTVLLGGTGELHADRHVEFAGGQLREAGALVGLDGVDGDGRLLVAQRAGDGGDQAPSADGNAPIRHRRHVALGVAGQVDLGLLELREDDVSVPQQDLCGVGQPHPPSVRFDELDARLAGERGELLGHRRRAQVQSGSRGRDGSVVGELAQHPQPTYIDHAAHLTGWVQKN